MDAADGLQLEALRGGRATRLRVRAMPGARRSAVVGLWNGRLKVALCSPPTAGRANRELVDLLARVLGLRARDLELERGARARLKDLVVEAEPARVRERLLPLLPPAS